jgi:hypothetical protein
VGFVRGAVATADDQVQSLARAAAMLAAFTADEPALAIGEIARRRVVESPGVPEEGVNAHAERSM